MSNTGFIKPLIEREHYILGGNNVPFKVLKDDGDWTADKRPEREIQAIQSFDTYNCTSFNTLNQIEQYLYVAFGETVNYSDRWLGIIAGTKPPGNDPHIVMEAIRKYGLIPESMLPFSTDLKNADEYYSFKGANEIACYEEGKKWLEKYDFKHEWCFDPNQELTKEEKNENIKTSLMVSPVSMAVYAWRTDNRGVYTRYGDDCHWTCCYAIKDFQKVFDSYEPLDKNVEQEIFYAKRINIDKKEQNIPVKKSLFSRLWEWFLREKLVYRSFKIFNIKNKI